MSKAVGFAFSVVAPVSVSCVLESIQTEEKKILKNKLLSNLPTLVLSPNMTSKKNNKRKISPKTQRTNQKQGTTPDACQREKTLFLSTKKDEERVTKM
jgi:hypothetical protein